MISFLEDEFKLSRNKATLVLGFVAFLASQPVIFFLAHGFVDELDFWCVNVFLLLFALIELILFGWVFGINKAWKEVHEGALIKIPKPYKFIMKFIAPAYIIVMFSVWIYQDFASKILLKGASPGDIPYIWGARGLILGFWCLVIVLVAIAWRKHNGKEKS